MREPGVSARLPRTPTAPRVARRLAAAVARASGCGHLAEDAALVTSELVTNAVQHASGPISLTIGVTGGALRIEVGDGSPVLPTRRDPLPTAPEGRGLPLIDALATTWGSYPVEGGKVVWAELGAAARPAGG